MRRNALFGIIIIVVLMLAAATMACSLPFLGSAEPTPTATLTVTAPLPAAEVTTPAPTASPDPGVTQVAAATGTLPTSECGYNAGYVADVTVADGTVFNPGDAFAKTWRLANIGCQDWQAGTLLMFVQGDLMGGPTTGVPVLLTAPTGVQDVTVNLVAPATTGHYRGYWQLKAPNGIFFGPKIFVDIVVANPGVTPPPAATVTTVPGWTLVHPILTFDFQLPTLPIVVTLNPGIILTLGPIMPINPPLNPIGP